MGRVPTLGSKIVSASGHAWPTHQDATTPDEDEKLFPSLHLNDGQDLRGIPVLVERSVV